MSTQRDELAREIFIADNRLAQDPAQVWNEASEDHRYYAVAIADGLIAAGYRKPRTITTVEELDALTVGSVVLVRRRAWTRFEPKQLPGALVEIHKWMCPDGGILRADSDQDIILPATVLYEPTA